MKLKITFIYLIFSFYWISTIFFTLPENYLQIKAMDYSKVFNTFFFQRWSFFAPPPQSNDRIYYEFKNDKGEKKTLEILKPLSIKRKNQFIFNSDVSVIDYVLSNSLTSITDYLREDYKKYKFEKCKNITDESICNEQFINDYSVKLHDLEEIKTLVNYGIITGKKNLDLNKYSKFKIIATNIEIPKFVNRFSKKKTKENLLFETKLYNIKLSKWEK